MLDDDGGSDTQDITLTINGAVCFAAGTLIETEHGPRPVETLTAGTRLRTLDHGLQTLRWTGAMPVSTAEMRADPRLRPVRIRAGALGPGRPARDLRLSRQHRVLLRIPAAREAFGGDEILIPAARLTALPGIRVEDRPRAVVYYHVLLDRHEVIFSDGAATESMLPAPRALQALPAAARAEVLALLAGLARSGGHAAHPARPLAQDGADLRRILAALKADDMPPLQPAKK